MNLSGDGWAVQSQGLKLWGIEGAAGLMLRAPGEDGYPLVLMQHRAGWTSMPFTWGVPGGARDLDETPEQAALREAGEEAGIDLSKVQIIQADTTARFSVDYGLRRVPANDYPHIEPFSSLDGSKWVNLLDPSVTEWTYTTVSAFAPYPLELDMNDESIEMRWVPEAEIDSLDLMAPFREALPMTRCRIIEGATMSESEIPMRAGSSGEAPQWLVR